MPFGISLSVERKNGIDWITGVATKKNVSFLHVLWILLVSVLFLDT